MRDDFAAFILTHGRADRVDTYKTLRNCGYTGKVYIVIDDEDKTADEYRKRYGDMVLQFGKAEIAKTFDEGDNFNDRRAIIYARNACFNRGKSALSISWSWMMIITGSGTGSTKAILSALLMTCFQNLSNSLKQLQPTP